MKKIVLLCAVLSLALFAEEVVEQRVLLAMEETPFKESLIGAMETLLSSDAVAVTIIEDHEAELEAISASEFDAVFITASGVNSEVRPWIVSWLDANSDESDKVIVHITQTRDWDTGLTVDAVTSASARGDVDSLAQSYVALLEQKLSVPTEE